MRISIIAALVALTAPWPALAQEIPRYDPEAYCRADTDSHSLYNLCIDDEQDYYDSLRSQWPSVPGDIRSYCIDENRGELPSYSLLELCVDDELSASSDVRSFSFD